MIAAVLVAAGSSRRMGFDKLFAELAGIPVIQRTMDVFLDHPEVDELIVVGSEGNRDRLESLLGPRGRVVLGGKERCHSVWNGIQAADETHRWIAVHDGARPLVSGTDIHHVFAKAREDGAATLAHPVTDTLKRAHLDGRVRAAVDRDHLWGMETPQCFRRDWLMQAYEGVMDAGRLVTDEVSALAEQGRDVFLVQSQFPNPKITFPPDIELAESLLAAAGNFSD
ncbi:MAG: 2-C-methyl-D-erythritol 4-phosphate cytidylyltransferase [Verrucomicrobiota bacterium]